MSSDINVQTFSGKVNITSNLLVGNSHLFVDTTNNRVGLITTSPDAGLHVNSNAYVDTDFRVGPSIVMNDTSGRITAGSFEGDGSALQGINSDSGSWVNGTDVVHLATIGDKVGIGVNPPLYKLDVDGDINFTGALKYQGSDFVSTPWTIHTSPDALSYTAGNIGIGGAASATNTLRVTGTVEATTGFSGILVTDVPTLNQNTTGTSGGITFTEVSVTAPNVTSGTWSEGNNTDTWGPPKFNTTYNNYAHNDPPGYRQWNIPTGMKSAYISHLQWSSSGYADVHGVRSDGALVFLRRINTLQSVTNTLPGGNHDGSTITFIGSGLDSFSSIRITNQAGTIHLTGLAFTPTLDGTEGTGMVHPQQLSTTLSASQIPTLNQNTTGSAGTLLAQAYINRVRPYSDSLASGYNTAALEIREYNLENAAGGTEWSRAPRIGFHWGARVASQLILESSGAISCVNNPGTAYEQFKCAAFTCASLTASGNVGIGTASPQSALHVAGSSGSGNTSRALGIHMGVLASTYAHMEIVCAGSTSGWIDFKNANTIGNGDYEERIRGGDGNLVFHAGKSERMKIDSSGNVGIGTTSPLANLDVQTATRTGSTTGGNGIYVTSDSGEYSNGSEFRHSNQTQGVGIGYAGIYATGSTTNQALFIISRGTGITYVKNYQAYSDDRVKTNEEYITNATNTLMKLKPQVYDKHEEINVISDNPKREAGLIAQDIYYDAPELRFVVSTRNTGMDAEPLNIPSEKPFVDEDPTKDPDYSGWGTGSAGVAYIQLIPYLIKSNQEIYTDLQTTRTQVQLEKIKTYELQQRVELLEMSHGALLERIEALENL